MNNDDLDNLLGEVSEPEVSAISEVSEVSPILPSEPEVVSAEDDADTSEPADDTDEDGITSVRFTLRVKFPSDFEDKFKKALRADASKQNKALLATLPEGSDLSAEQKTTSKMILNNLVADAFISAEKAVLSYVDASQTREFAVRSSAFSETKAKLAGAMETLDKLRAQMLKMGLSPEEIDALMS